VEASPVTINTRSTRRWRAIAVLVAVVGSTTATLALPAAAHAQGSDAHLHGGSIVVDDGTIEVDLVCRDGSDQPIEVLLDVAEDGGVGTSELFYCENLQASGPLGDASVDLACVAVWDGWPVDGATQLDLGCDLDITIFDQPFPPPTDALCQASLDHTFPAGAGNDLYAGSWHQEDIDDSFGNVAVDASCPAFLAEGIEFFLAASVDVLLDFLFETPPPTTSPTIPFVDMGHFEGGAVDVGDGTIILDLDCDDGQGPVVPLFEIVEGEDEWIGEIYDCEGIDASGPLGDAEITMSCVATWDGGWPVDATTGLDLECDLDITIFDQPLPPPTDASCTVDFEHTFSARVGNTNGFGSWPDDDVGGSFGTVATTGTCPSLLSGGIAFFLGLGVEASVDFSFSGP
jgi:hypothetical protein